MKNVVVKKDAYDAKIKDIEDDKTPNLTNLDTNTTLNAKVSEVQNETPSITNLDTTAAINAKINEVKNKIFNITNLVTHTSRTVVERNNQTIVNILLLQNVTS